MIFNIANGPIRRTPVLDESYPKDVSAGEVGTSVTFNILIAEPGKPEEYTCQWYYDDAAVAGETGTSYTREAEFGAHTVYCIVTNKAGAVISRRATLTAEIQYIYNVGTIDPIAGGVARNNTKNAYTLNSTTIHINSTGTNAWGHVYFTNPIDLTPYKTLYFVGNVTITGAGDYWGSLTFGAFKSLSSSVAAGISGAKSQGTYAIDVSNLTGTYYISTYLKGFANYAVADISKVYLK